jgi:hypothetical protein
VITNVLAPYGESFKTTFSTNVFTAPSFLFTNTLAGPAVIVFDFCLNVDYLSAGLEEPVTKLEIDLNVNGNFSGYTFVKTFQGTSASDLSASSNNFYPEFPPLPGSGLPGIGYVYGEVHAIVQLEYGSVDISADVSVTSNVGNSYFGEMDMWYSALCNFSTAPQSEYGNVSTIPNTLPIPDNS